MSRHVTLMTIDDAGHYSPGQRAEIIAAYPEHEREARAKGIPVPGSGRIFPVPEELIACEPFKLPRLGALDFGWDHPAAAVELAWDTEADVSTSPRLLELRSRRRGCKHFRSNPGRMAALRLAARRPPRNAGRRWRGFGQAIRRACAEHALRSRPLPRRLGLGRGRADGDARPHAVRPLQGVFEPAQLV